MKRVTRHPDGGWVALSRYGSTIATTSTRAAAWEAVHDAAQQAPYVPRLPPPLDLTTAERQARAAAEDLCDGCGGVGRCLVRGPCGHHSVRAAAIISCPDCDGKGVKL